MRFPVRSSFLLLLLLAPAAEAENLALLRRAVRTAIAERDRWACTETTQRLDASGRAVGGPTIETHDPSRRFDDQWVLFRYQGHVPTESDVAAWRRDKENQFRHDRTSLSDLFDLDHARLVEATPARAIYRVPLLSSEKLIATLEIDTSRQVLTAFTIPGQAAGQLANIDSKHAPALVCLKWTEAGHFLGILHDTLAETTYTGFRRVRPYNGRFAVNIGQLQSVDD